MRRRKENQIWEAGMPASSPPGREPVSPLTTDLLVSNLRLALATGPREGRKGVNHLKCPHFGEGLTNSQ